MWNTKQLCGCILHRSSLIEEKESYILIIIIIIITSWTKIDSSNQKTTNKQNVNNLMQLAFSKQVSSDW